jgi:hypothetical protein
MTEIIKDNPKSVSVVENQKLDRLFYVFAAFQILIILCGAILVLLVAPASLFVSTTESEAFFWIAAGFIGLMFIALGVVLIPLSIAAARGISQEKNWGRIVGIIAAILAFFEFPLGTIFGGYLLWKLFRRQ